MSHPSRGYMIDPMNGSNRVIKEELNTETEMHSTETPNPMDACSGQPQSTTTSRGPQPN